MISNEKKLNYKIVDLDEKYNFHLNFFLQPSSYKKFMIFSRYIGLYVVWNATRERYNSVAMPTSGWEPYRRLKWRLRPYLRFNMTVEV
jgi:hypothetical protein